MEYFSTNLPKKRRLEGRWDIEEDQEDDLREQVHAQKTLKSICYRLY